MVAQPVGKTAIASLPKSKLFTVLSHSCFIVQFCNICEEYLGTKTLLTMLSRLFSVFTPKICIVISGVPRSCPLRDEQKF